MRLVSSRTILWSLFPIEGSGLHLSINEGWDVKMRSNVLSFLVGNDTICSKLLSAVMSRKLLFTRKGFWLPSTCSEAQLMSGRLKSPSRSNMFLLHSVRMIKDDRLE